MIGGYYRNRSHASADLKRTAHAVRAVVDARPVTAAGPHPRKSRKVHRESLNYGEGGKFTKFRAVFESPELSPRARHEWAQRW